MKVPRQLESIASRLRSGAPLLEYYQQKECVYFLLARGNVVYIGRSANLAARLHQHKRDGKRFDDAVYTYDTGNVYKYFGVKAPNRSHRSPTDLMEEALISYFRPKYNKQAHNSNWQPSYCESVYLKALGFPPKQPLRSKPTAKELRRERIRGIETRTERRRRMRESMEKRRRERDAQAEKDRELHKKYSRIRKILGLGRGGRTPKFVWKALGIKRP